MKGDFTRSTFKREKHYSSVRMQQGRVQLDADWNEQVEIARHRIETETVDVIGHCGAPKHDAGFEIITEASQLPADKQQLLNGLKGGDFIIGKGRFYAGGILCENEDYIPFTKQPDLPNTFPIGGPGIYMAYLDVWQSHVTAIEDPYIREVALGGPDTATRTRTIWQVKLALLGDKPDCANEPWLTAESGKLIARAQPSPSSDGPCVVAPGAGYRRLENQLYRVEIHQPSSTGNPTYKWSRENGSVVVPIDELKHAGDAKKIRVRSLGKDDNLGLHLGDWVEVLDDDTELLGVPGTLAKINDLDAEQLILTLSGPLAGYDIDKHPKVRRWDSDGELDVSAAVGAFAQLEDGVEVRFEQGNFKTGDYWLIPARTVPGRFGDIEWPRDDADNALALAPLGIKHHYCSLGLITVKSGSTGLSISDVKDCRPIFPPLTELPAGGASCCTVTVGDGKTSQGDFQDIQAAIDSIAKSGGKVCILAGKYEISKPIAIKNLQNLTVSGCGNRTQIQTAGAQAIFEIAECSNLRLESLTMFSFSRQATILAREVFGFDIADCLIMSAFGKQEQATFGTLIDISKSKSVRIINNHLEASPQAIHAIKISAQFAEITGNRIQGGGVAIRGGSYDVSIENNFILNGNGPGIMLGGAGSELDKAKFIFIVSIFDNKISEMGGSGITTDMDAGAGKSLVFIEDLNISRNQILNCANGPLPTSTLAGAPVLGGIVLGAAVLVQIDGNTIAGNGANSFACGIFIFNSFSIVVTGNSIFGNGTSQPANVSGYQMGIAALMVAGEVTTDMPALRIHDNTVSTPSGQALAVAAFGSVSINSNKFTSHGWRQQPYPVDNFRVLDFGACVSIYNLGWSELKVPNATPDFLKQLLANPVVPPQQPPDNIPDGRVMFNDNQVLFSGTLPVTGQAQLGKLSAVKFSIIASVLMVSLDDISINANQFRTQISGLMEMFDVAVHAMTVRACGNRFSERLFTCWYSYISTASLLNVTTSNEGTHFIAGSSPYKNQMANNLTLI